MILFSNKPYAYSNGVYSEARRGIIGGLALWCSFLKGRTTAREAHCQLRYVVFDFSISFFSMFAFPSGLGKVWIGLWCLPERKRTFNFRQAARGMKDVSMDGTVGTKARLMPCSGSAVHAPEVRSTSGIREFNERLVGNF